MDDETRKAIAQISDGIEKMHGEYGSIRGELVNVNGHVSGLRKEVRSKFERLEEDVGQLKTAVFGSSNPPPPPDGPASTPTPAVAFQPVKTLPHLATRQQSAEHDIDALRGMLLTTNAKVDKALAHVEAQSRTMGVAVGEPKEDPEEDGTQLVPMLQRFKTFLMSREGVSFVMRLATLAAVAYGAFYATLHGTPPGPWAAPNSTTTMVAPSPPAPPQLPAPAPSTPAPKPLPPGM